MLKNQKKNIITLLKNRFMTFFRFLGENTWIFTLLFFGAVLVAAVWIWGQCVYRPTPSVTVLNKIKAEREDFDDMKKKTVEAITFLQEYRENYYNSNKFSEQRELFIDVLDDKVIERMNAAKNPEIEGEVEAAGAEKQTEVEVENLPATVTGNSM
jgi:hypothetical protein